MPENILDMIFFQEKQSTQTYWTKHIRNSAKSNITYFLIKMDPDSYMQTVKSKVYTQVKYEP